jgi:hypothetical protein
MTTGDLRVGKRPVKKKEDSIAPSNQPTSVSSGLDSSSMTQDSSSTNTVVSASLPVYPLRPEVNPSSNDYPIYSNLIETAGGDEQVPSFPNTDNYIVDSISDI